MQHIPESNFTRNIRGVFGAAGEAWIATLPDLVARCEQTWQVRIGSPVDGLSFNYVAPAVRDDGAACMFKACFSGEDNDILAREITALRLYNGGGMCKLLQSDQAEGVMLLERLTPGTQLAALEDDDHATQIAADVIRTILQPAPAKAEPFVTAQDLADQLRELRATFGGTGPYPRRLVEMAETLFRDLIASSGPPMLIHADLHHYNILLSGNEWRGIDPHGVIAEAGFECGALLRNPNHTLPKIRNLQPLMERRIAILAESLGFDRQRITAWAMAQAMLSVWWTYEDVGEIDTEGLRCAEAFAALVE